MDLLDAVERNGVDVALRRELGMVDRVRVHVVQVEQQKRARSLHHAGDELAGRNVRAGKRGVEERVLVQQRHPQSILERGGALRYSGDFLARKLQRARPDVRRR